jgi:hypothetical protein
MSDTDSLSENGVQCNISGKLDNSSIYLFYSRNVLALDTYFSPMADAFQE